MKKATFDKIHTELLHRGYADEIKWQRELKPVTDSYTFLHEAIWVILNSGMKEQIARKIKERINQAIEAGADISTVFRHEGKVKAIKYLLNNYKTIFEQYRFADNKVEFLKIIPWIGPITCWHLAKNLGLDVVKPDRHLVRVASKYNMTPDDICEKLSKETGEKKCVIDIIIWRACNQGLL